MQDESIRPPEVKTPIFLIMGTFHSFSEGYDGGQARRIRKLPCETVMSIARSAAAYGMPLIGIKHGYNGLLRKSTSIKERL